MTPALGEGGTPVFSSTDEGLVSFCWLGDTMADDLLGDKTSVLKITHKLEKL